MCKSIKPVYIIIRIIDKLKSKNEVYRRVNWCTYSEMVKKYKILEKLSLTFEPRIVTVK